MAAIKKCLITGGTSGLGARLAARLGERGYEVRIILSGRPSTSPKAHPMPHGALVYIADLTGGPNVTKILEEACRGVDAVFHVAGITNLKGDLPEKDFMKVNVEGTDALLKACTAVNGEERDIRFMYVSSISVYGNKRKGEVLTEQSMPRPETPYGKSKLMAEQHIKRYTELHKNIRYTIFRVANMYGPSYEKQFHRSWKLQMQQKMVYVGDGGNHQTLVHVDDVIDCMMLALTSPYAIYQTYNVSDGEAYTMRQLLEKGATFLGVDPPKKKLHPFIATFGARTRGIMQAELDYMTGDRVISIKKAKDELGFAPKRSTDKEGKEMVEDFLKEYNKSSGPSKV